jgi:hypothetical protein
MLDDNLLRRRLTWEDARAFEKSKVEFFPSDEPGGAPLALDVVSVRERPPVVGAHQFSIIFRGPREPLLPQRTYRVRHPSLGDYALFVTAVGQSAASTDYEACFSHVT